VDYPVTSCHPPRLSTFKEPHWLPLSRDSWSARARIRKGRENGDRTAKMAFLKLPTPESTEPAKGRGGEKSQ
jgi:hypothetical protein